MIRVATDLSPVANAVPFLRLYGARVHSTTVAPTSAALAVSQSLPDPSGHDPMRLAAPFSTSRAGPNDARPRDDELDLYGLTHPGRVRAENQDHFLLCTVHPQVVVRGTSLPDPEHLALRGQRLATIMLVADGVGGSAAGSR